MVVSVPQLLHHARKPVRPRELVRHQPPERKVLHHEKKGVLISQPILASILLHLVFVSATAALCLSQKYLPPHLVEQGRGGVTLVLEPSTTISAPSTPSDPVSQPPTPSTAMSPPVEMPPPPLPEAASVLPPTPLMPPAPPSVVLTSPAPATPRVHVTPKKSSSRSAASEAVASRGAITRANPIYNPSPSYPETARENGQQGRVNLELTVTPDGNVARARVVQTSGHVLLDQAALTTVRRWKFSQGSAACTFQQSVTFNLNDGVEE